MVKNQRDINFTGGLIAAPSVSSRCGEDAMRFLAEIINTPNTTVYDKAIDSVYLDTHVGGSQLHHLIDGQHDIFGAFEAASRALPDDTLWQELMGTAQHLGKDLFSVSGLPVVSLEPGSYQTASTWASEHLHLSKGWLGDLLQVNALELFSGVLSVVAVVLGCKKGDMRQLAELSAASGLAGMLSANPIALSAAAIALVMAWKHRSNPADLGKSLAVGAGVSGVAMGVGGLLAVLGVGSGLLPALGGILLSAVLGLYARKFLVRHLYGADEPSSVCNDVLPEPPLNIRPQPFRIFDPDCSATTAPDPEVTELLRRALRG